MKYLCSYLLAATFLLAEVHTFWERNDVANTNFIYAREVPMWLSWNIKGVASQIIWIILPIAAILYGKTTNLVNRSAWIAYIGYCLLDTIAYFYNYKTFGYAVVYPLVVVIFLIAYFKGK